MFRRVWFATALLILSFFFTPAWIIADDVYWDDAAGGNFSDGTNWDMGVAPGPGDNAFITLDGTYTVVLDANTAVQSLTLGAASGTQILSLSGRTLTLTGLSSIGTNGEVFAIGSTINQSAGLANGGSMLMRGSSSLTGGGVFSNDSGAVLRVEGSLASATGSLTVANGFTNAGVIELGSVNAIRTAQLSVSSGTLVNTNLIDVQAGSGGARYLYGAIDNQGTIDFGTPATLSTTGAAAYANSGDINIANGDVSFSLTSDTLSNSGTIDITGGNLSLPSAASFTNTGDITIGSGRTLSLSSTTFNQNAGSVGGPGTLSIYIVTVNFMTDFSNTVTTLLVSNSTINGPGTLTNANTLDLIGSTINSPFTNSGDLLIRGASHINSGPGEFTTGAANTIRIEGSLASATGSLTVANGFTNAGVIELGSVNAIRTAQLTVSSGTLVNTNLIDVQAGSGGARYLYGAIDNQGTIDFGTPATLSTTGAAAYANSGDINIANGDVSFSLTSDTLSNSGTIDITGGNLSLPSATSFTNTGDITIGSGRTLSLSSTTFNQNAGSVGGPGTLSIYIVTVNFMTDFSNTVTTLLVSNSTINGPGTLTNANTLDLIGSTINSPFTNSGDLLIRGASHINSGPGEFTTGAANTIRIEGSLASSTGSLTVANGFTNPGIIELGSVNAIRTAQLTVSSGTLVNTNLIDVQVGSGGARYLYGAIDNQGTLDFGTPATVSTSGAAAYANSGDINIANGDVSFSLTSDTLSNSGTIDITGGNLSLPSAASFTNTGDITIGSGRTLSLSSTTFNQNAGSVGGPGTLSIYIVTVNFMTDFSNTVTTLLVSNSTINGPGTLTNANTLDLIGSTINSPFTNSGDLLIRGASHINSGPGEFTTGAANTIRIEGSLASSTGSLTVANGFTNPGIIELGSVNAIRTAQLTVSSGTLVNTNLIDVQAGSGGARYLYGAIDNQGTIDFGTPATLSTTGAAAYANSGDINIANGDVSFSLTSDTLSNSGTIDITGGNLSLPSAASFTNTGDITIGGGRTLSLSSTTFNQNAGSVGGPGTLSIYIVTVNFMTDFSNTVTTLLVSNSTINGPGTLTNANTLDLIGSTINSPFTNSGDLLIRGASHINSGPGEFTTGAANTIRIEGSLASSTGSLTVANGFTNPGIIELGSVNAIRTAQLTVSSGTLVNTNLIDVQAGSGGARYLYGAIDNQGTLDFGTPATVSTSGAAAYANSGDINIANGDVNFSLHSDTFTNSGTIGIAAGGQLFLNSGTFINFSAGTLTGGTYDVAGTFKFTGAAITTIAAEIILDGSGATTVNQSATDAMPGLATITGDGVVEITNGYDLSLTGPLANAGQLTVGDGSTLTVNGDLTQTEGSTHLDNGTLELGSTFDLQQGELTGSGTVDGDLASAGTIGPGASPGHLIVTGSHTQTGAHQLEIELTGTDSADFDRLDVTGAATIDGDLAVTLLGGFAPPPGTTYDIVSGSSVTPTFVTTNLPLVYPGGCLDILYPGDRVRLDALAAVVITTPPQSQTICPGDPATFSVAASGGGTLGYQWRKNGIDIPLANLSTFTIAAVSSGDEALYDVVVGNLCGGLASSTAELTMGAAPVVTIDPMSQVAYEGQPVKFTVEVDAAPEPGYQWRRGGIDLSGETGPSLVLSDVTPADDGDYNVVITNDCGTQTSAPATLEVVDPPLASIGRSFCSEPDHGFGRPELPPELCEYLSPSSGDIFVITDGLPAGATIEAVPVLSEFVCLASPCGSPGGALGGEIELFDATLRLHLTGTGALAGFERIVSIPVATETHSGSRTPGADLQVFAVDLYSLEGSITGDPDFDQLEIRAGTGLGLPSPGNAVLTRRAGAAYSIDELFDLSYEIDFVGAPGSALDGLSGTTAGAAKLAVAAPPMPMDHCLVPDTGGTAELPPAGCHFHAPDEPIIITDGLPPGTTIELQPIERDFSCLTTPCGQPGGALGGEVELYDSTLDLAVHGTGSLAGFERVLSLSASSETNSAPRTQGDPVQHFLTLAESLQASLVGDPDFASLVITAGDSAGLPSPGMTTLTDHLDGTFVVDSFFDLSYQIDFVGAPGGALDGLSGTSYGRVGLTATNPPLFADGFESGDTSAW